MSISLRGFRNVNPEVSFWLKVVKGETDDCWFWLAHRDRWGYGCFAVRQRPIKAHRYSWQLHNGPIPDGICVLHRCDNPACVNPAHLFLGTHADNMADKFRKGRQSKGPMHAGTLRQVFGEDHPKSKLTWDKVASIRADYATGLFTYDDLGKKHGITKHYVGAVVRGQVWRRRSPC